MIRSGNSSSARRLSFPAQSPLPRADPPSWNFRMAKEEHAKLYFGRSGELAAMSELLYRGHNVADPEVDVGDDVFVVRDEEDRVTRVQVKSANATGQHDGYIAQFSIP